MNEKVNRGRDMVDVQILGEQYTLKSEASPDYTRRVAEYVDRTAAEIREEGGVIDQKKLAILTALAITDQLFRLRDNAERVRGLIEKRAEQMTEEVLAVVGHAAEP